MPKMKTDKGAAKRVKVTGTGRLRRRHANRSHLLRRSRLSEPVVSDVRVTFHPRTSARSGGCWVAEPLIGPPALLIAAVVAV
jgi:large subunit ribosomal protein L35